MELQVGHIEIATELGTCRWRGQPRLHFCRWKRVGGYMFKLITKWKCLRITYHWHEND